MERRVWKLLEQYREKWCGLDYEGAGGWRGHCKRYWGQNRRGVRHVEGSRMRDLRVPGWCCHSSRWGIQRAEAVGKARGESCKWAALPRPWDTHEEMASGHLDG